MPLADLGKLGMYSANEIKRQGCLIGQPSEKYRAWELDGFIAVINERDNAVVAIFDASQLTWPVYVNLKEIGSMILTAAGVR